jgi:uncharacterized protein YcbK (DUF882 family)
LARNLLGGALMKDPRHASAAHCSRRLFLGFGLVVAGGLVSPAARAALAAPRKLSFYHTHTGETLSATYWQNGMYDTRALGELDYILRDFVNGEEVSIDRRLLDLLNDLHRRLDSHGPFEIISAYRSPSTNAMLRANSDGVAKNSYHMKAMAIDIRLNDVPLDRLHQVAVDMKQGGVGIYHKSDFVHVDVGPVRYW